MRDIEVKTIVRGALLLTIASFVSKILSASYRIPLQNLTGDVGFYIYQQVYPLLGMIVILALYGFPSAISTLAAEQQNEKQQLSLRSFYLPILLILGGVVSLLAILLYVSAPWVTSFIGDEQLVSAYRLVALAFLFIPAVALLRGSFQGLYMMQPIAYSQIGEQFFRVAIIIFVAFYVSRGNYSIYAIGEAGVYAAMVGAVVAFLILLYQFIKLKPYTLKHNDIPWKKYLMTLISLGLVASLNHMILLVIQLADVFTLIPNLIEHGYAPLEAMEQKGIFDRGQPLIQIGTVIGSSFALAFIPASVTALDDQANSQRHIRHAFSFSFYLAAGATIGLLLIFPEVNSLLYKNTLGTGSLRILSLAVLLSSLCITITSVLQGLNFYKRTALFILLAFVVKWLLNYLLVPLFGISGSSLATVLSLVFLMAAVIRQLVLYLPNVKLFSHIKWQPFLTASFSMVVYLLIVRSFFSFQMWGRSVLLIYVLILVISGAALYFLILLRMGAFTEEQIKSLPYARVWLKLNKGREKNGK